jgi:hypothetical protein
MSNIDFSRPLKFLDGELQNYKIRFITELDNTSVYKYLLCVKKDGGDEFAMCVSKEGKAHNFVWNVKNAPHKVKIRIYWDAKFKTIVDVIGEKYFESYNKAESFVFLKELEVEIPENNV